MLLKIRNSQTRVEIRLSKHVKERPFSETPVPRSSVRSGLGVRCLLSVRCLPALIGVLSAVSSRSG